VKNSWKKFFAKAGDVEGQRVEFVKLRQIFMGVRRLVFRHKSAMLL
jgi:hypothetical protein